MKYRNIKTGAVIDTDSAVVGRNWEPVKNPVKKTAKKGTVKK